MRHLLAELIMKILNYWSLQELLSGKPQDMSENNNRLLNVSPHSDRYAHIYTHTVPENIHRSAVTLLVLTQTEDETSEERRDGT